MLDNPTSEGQAWEMVDESIKNLSSVTGLHVEDLNRLEAFTRGFLPRLILDAANPRNNSSLIGRPTKDVTPNIACYGDKSISAEHAQLVANDGRYRIRDLGSTNGTWSMVDAGFAAELYEKDHRFGYRPIQGEMTLESGSIIRLGDPRDPEALMCVEIDQEVGQSKQYIVPVDLRFETLIRAINLEPEVAKVYIEFLESLMWLPRTNTDHWVKEDYIPE